SRKPPLRKARGEAIEQDRRCHAHCGIVCTTRGDPSYAAASGAFVGTSARCIASTCIARRVRAIGGHFAITVAYGRSPAARCVDCSEKRTLVLAAAHYR